MKTRQYLLGKLKKALNLAIKSGPASETILLAKEIERLGDIPEKNELSVLDARLKNLETKAQVYDSALNLRQIANGRIGVPR